MGIEIIAEIGQNHNGDLGAAKEMISAAKSCGADVAKFQIYDARALFPGKETNPWFDYNCKTELSRDAVNELFYHCQTEGIEFMASVFDVERVGWVLDLPIKRIKIASRSIFDVGLIEVLGDSCKPLIVSLGHWNKSEFPTIPTSARLDFLYCISKYPTELSELSLSKVDFSRYSGFSDHTVGNTAACSAIVLGASIVEKHFTLDKNQYGPDHICSMTPKELEELCGFRDQWVMCR